MVERQPSKLRARDVSQVNTELYDTSPATTSSNASSSEQRANLAPRETVAIADLLVHFGDDERAAVIKHLRALANMSPAKRAALLTLTTGEEDST